MSDTLDIALVGVGGQGTILASDVLAELGMRLGHDVKKAEVHGMSQRGGSVVSHVRWGPQVHSPIIPAGGADVVVAVEKMEAARYAALLAPRGTVILNDHAIEPLTVITGGAAYPSDPQIEQCYTTDQRMLWLDATATAERLGNAAAANVVLLGALCAVLDLDVELCEQVLRGRVADKHLAVNLAALREGVRAAQG
ncbi:MAG TPA: indolepyruvate oxidoreductase subunit beta [Dermatophilaceae bacterium]|mgnify:CR=1 FL=1|nr:indolepyruvate oxidoreductase subunit beta [Dermatophilaceae bacterium]